MIVPFSDPRKGIQATAAQMAAAADSTDMVPVFKTIS
jgi:hypothetical protein